MKDYLKYQYTSTRNKKVYMVNSRFILDEDDIEVLYPKLHKKYILKKPKFQKY